jgi:undecaprenyl-diphosphatase
MSNYKSFFKKRFDREKFIGLPLTAFVIVFFILLGTLVGITDAIVNSSPIVKIDQIFAQFLYLFRTPLLAHIFYAITTFANQGTIITLTAIALIFLYFKKELAYFYALILILLGTEVTLYLMKIFVDRSRPASDIAYYIENTKSFPSGHSAIAVAFFGFIMYYLTRHINIKYMRSAIIFLGTLLILLIGFSRLYLGVHYLSDVLGGFLMGGLWLIVGITFREQHFYAASLTKGKFLGK